MAEFVQEETSDVHSKAGLKKSLLWVFGVLLLYFCVEALVFRGPWYRQWLEPDSSAGNFEMHLNWLDQHDPDLPEVLVVGDSRIGEGFFPKLAQEKSDQKVYWWNFGVPGTTPRAWYYLLRDADPERNRFHTIAIALDRLEDIDRYDSGPMRILDLNFVICRLRLSDIHEFSSSMGSPELRHEAFMGATFKGYALKDDFLAYAGDIRGRRNKVRLSREVGLSSNEGYGGNSGTLEGLHIQENGGLEYPDHVSEELRNLILKGYRDDYPSQLGETTQYRKYWLGKVLELYRNSSTKIVFLESPRGPLPPVAPEAPMTFLKWAQEQYGVRVLDASTFRFLETPETFFDQLHLNRKGRELFTKKLVQSLDIH